MNETRSLFILKRTELFFILNFLFIFTDFFLKFPVSSSFKNLFHFFVSLLRFSIWFGLCLHSFIHAFIVSHGLFLWLQKFVFLLLLIHFFIYFYNSFIFNFIVVFIFISFMYLFLFFYIITRFRNVLLSYNILSS